MSFLSKPLDRIKHWAMDDRKERVIKFSDGCAVDIEALGVKGASLCEMTKLGLPVPHGFVISTNTSVECFENNFEFPDGLMNEYTRVIHDMERDTGLTYGTDRECPPLIVAVRSGSSLPSPTKNLISSKPKHHLYSPESWSSPGCSKTLLNVGLNEKLVNNLAKSVGPRFALDSYIRHLMDFGVGVFGMNPKQFTSMIKECKENRGGELTLSDLQYLVMKFKSIVNVPEDPWTQLSLAIQAVYKHWFADAAIRYRSALDVSQSGPGSRTRPLGVAVIVQAMVFGNSSYRSGSGFAFSRDPVSGKPGIHGEWVSDAEGEEVLDVHKATLTLHQLQATEPAIVQELQTITTKLEVHYRDMQCIEFATDGAYVSILQTKPAPRTCHAAVRVALDMVQEGLVTERDALLKIDASAMHDSAFDELDLTSLTSPRHSDASIHIQDKHTHTCKLLAKGNWVSHGIATGKLVFTANDCEDAKERGESVVFCSSGVSDNVAGEHMDVTQLVQLSSAVVLVQASSEGDLSVLCRAMNRPCVSFHDGDGARGVHIVSTGGLSALSVYGLMFYAGELVTVHGSSGSLYLGRVPVVSTTPVAEISKVLQLADKYRTTQVLVNIKSFSDLAAIERFSSHTTVSPRGVSDGIGCFCTAFLFTVDTDRRDLTRKVLLASSVEERRPHLQLLQSLQKEDMKHIIRGVKGEKLCVRLLNESLWNLVLESNVAGGLHDPWIIDLAQRLLMPVAQVKAGLKRLREDIPVAQIGISAIAAYPYLLELQVGAIVGAVAAVALERGLCVVAEANVNVGDAGPGAGSAAPGPVGGKAAARPGIVQIAVPMVLSEKELVLVVDRIQNAANRVMTDCGLQASSLPYSVGIYVDTPEACLGMSSMAPHVSFVIFDLQRLTELVLGVDRKVLQRHMHTLLNQKTFQSDPFRHTDEAVCAMLKRAVFEAHAANPALHCSVLLGESGADARTMKFFHDIDISAVSSAQELLDENRLTAAQAHILSTREAHSRSQHKHAEHLYTFPNMPNFTLPRLPI